MDRRDFVLTAGATAVAAMRSPSALAARFGGTPLAYVTADLENHVVVLDLSKAKVVKRIRTAPGPRSIEAVQATLAVVAHTEHGVVSIIDAQGRLCAEVGGFGAPRYTAVHPKLGYAYVTDSVRGEVVVLDAYAERIVGRVDVPGPARHISASPDGRTIWTALGTDANDVAVLDASNAKRPKLVRTFAPPFRAHDVVFAPDGSAIWLTSGSEQRVALYRLGRAPQTLRAGAPPQHVAFGWRRAFVSSGDDGTVRRHRLDGALVREARVPVGSYNLSSLHGRVVAPSLGNGTIALLDATGRVQVVRKVARAAHDACIVVGP